MKVADAFQPHQKPPRALPIRCHILKREQAKAVEDFLVKKLPECYTTITQLKKRARVTGRSPSELLANRLPDPGPVMSGDFGEVLTLFFLSSERPEKTKLVMKWRYKQDRRKPAPHSDVIILHRRKRDAPSKTDFVICAETKQKATHSERFIPISEAVRGFEKDRIGRLARSLAWLRERAIDRDLPKNITYIERFTNDLSVEYCKYFKAVVILERDLLDKEITRKIGLPGQDASFEIVALGVGSLKSLYEAVFKRAIKEVTIE